MRHLIRFIAVLALVIPTLLPVSAAAQIYQVEMGVDGMICAI